MSGRRWTFVVIAVLMPCATKRALATPARAACDSTSASVPGATVAVARGVGWSGPLQHVVELEGGEMTLGEALDLVAARSGSHFTYSADLLPLSGRVCLARGSRPLGDVLAALLEPHAMSPLVIGADQVVLAPTRSAAAAAAVPTRAAGVGRLERVVVTGSATGTPERLSPLAITTLDRSALDGPGTGSLASTLSGAVPGVWVWPPSSSSVVARYGSVRGASSFGVSTPKVYVDGIEVANPLLFTDVDGTQIERIEVIRGPQGAALYGSDAISGVINVVTRHDGIDGGPITSVRAVAGSSQTAFSSGGVLSQEYGASLRSGAGAQTLALGISGTSLGAVTPGASRQSILGDAGLRHVGSRVVVTGTARFAATNAGAALNPLLRQYLDPSRGLDSTWQHVRQYTLGGSATLQSSETWAHSLTAGVDGYRLSGISAESVPLPSVADSALQAARGGADRLTLRLTSTHRLGESDRGASSFSVGLEHSTAREHTNGSGDELAPRQTEMRGPAGGAGGGVAEGPDAAVPRTTWWSNTGLFTQGQLAVTSDAIVTGGLRLEQMSGPSEDSRFALLPMLGGAWARDAGPITVKLRAAYGRGIRPVRTVARGATWSGGRDPRMLTALDPEEQSGVEGGADVVWGSLLTLRVTGFDQRATGLVQPVAILADVPAGTTGSPTRVLYQLQNVGAIANRGVEMEGTSALGELFATVTVTVVSSRVMRLATGYGGDLRVGDRMLEVPARTAGLRVGWTRGALTLGTGAARAWDWVNYDKLALAQVAGADPTGRTSPVGSTLRAYWRTYTGATHIDADAGYRLGQRTSITLDASNLLNHQTGEPDDVTIVPGRTLRLGLRNAF